MQVQEDDEDKEEEGKFEVPKSEAHKQKTRGISATGFFVFAFEARCRSLGFLINASRTVDDDELCDVRTSYAQLHEHLE